MYILKKIRNCFMFLITRKKGYAKCSTNDKNTNVNFYET